MDCKLRIIVYKKTLIISGKIGYKGDVILF